MNKTLIVYALLSLFTATQLQAYTMTVRNRITAGAIEPRNHTFIKYLVVYTDSGICTSGANKRFAVYPGQDYSFSVNAVCGTELTIEFPNGKKADIYIEAPADFLSYSYTIDVLGSESKYYVNYYDNHNNKFPVTIAK